jgi:hypothetical protein
MTPYEAVYGQKANDGILVGANAVSEFIDEDQIEYLYENDSQTDIVAETDSQHPHSPTRRLTHRLTLLQTHRLNQRQSWTQRPIFRRIHQQIYRRTSNARQLLILMFHRRTLNKHTDGLTD